MKNEMFISEIRNLGKRFEVRFKCEGDCKKYFKQDIFYCEYEHDIKNVQNDILVIPFVCNILPILWIKNIKLHLDTLDEDFYASIREFRKLN